MSILGNPVARREDPGFLTGSAAYVDDLLPANALYLAYVRSPYAHARITAVDVDEAVAAPGVAGVFTGADVAEMGLAPNVLPMFPDAMKRPYVAADVVRYAGQPVVAVVAETQAQAVDATELVIVDYEPLAPVIDPEAAVRDEVLIFGDHGTNILSHMESPAAADFSACEVVVSERIVNQRLTAAPIEGRAGIAYWTAEGRLVHYSACQGAHPTRDLLARIYGLDPSDVRVVVPDVGGGFGAKSRTYPEELVIGFFSRALGRPVKWTETRSENVIAMPQGRGQIQYAKLGGTRDGHITAYQLDVVQDIGAYPLIAGVLAGMTQRMATGTYDLTNVGFSADVVVTNTVPLTAYRGAGRPEAAVAIERMVDRFAAEIGMDPAEVRVANLVPKFTEPYVTAMGTSYDVGDYPEALRSALDGAGYDELRAAQQVRRERGETPLLGIGISSYVEITAGAPQPEFGAVKLQPDGRLLITSGATPTGQGHDTTWAMIVADRTGVPLERIDVVHGDTDEVPRGGLTVGSRSVQLAGVALAQSATALVERAREAAAELLEAAVDDIVLDADLGAFHVVGTPTRTASWSQIAATFPDGVSESADFTAPQGTFPSGAHVAVVEVDPETGGTTLVRLVAADDAGALINPLLAEGQVHGGIAQGVAQALLEGIQYDEDGNLLTGNFMDYLVISAAELPSFEVVHIETPTWVNELGAKGVGESGTIGAIPAVYNAVVDAVSHLGVRHLTTPITPQQLCEAIQAASASLARPRAHSRSSITPPTSSVGP